MPSVDIIARYGRNGERTITPQQKKDIQNAANFAQIKISGIWSDMSIIWDQTGKRRKKIKKRKKAWKNNSNIIKWFGNGALTNYQIRRTKNRVRKLKSELDNTVGFVIIQEQTGKKSFDCKTDRTAYCSIGARIKLCPLFFLELNLKERAATIIHELCHKKGMIHRRGAKDKESALQLAKDHPRLARKNPENYERLSYEY